MIFVSEVSPTRIDHEEVHNKKVEFHNSQLDRSTKEQKYLTLKNDINDRLGALLEAEDNYYVTSKYVLELTKHAYELFMISEVEQKRQLITLVLQTICLDGKNVVLFGFIYI